MKGLIRYGHVERSSAKNLLNRVPNRRRKTDKVKGSWKENLYDEINIKGLKGDSLGIDGAEGASERGEEKRTNNVSVRPT